MRLTWTAPARRSLGFFLSLSLLAMACEDDADWTPPRYGQLPDVLSQTDINVSQCQCDQMMGRAFRFTSTVVTEPDYPDSGADEVLRDLLNDIWFRDIENDVLNIIFELREMEPDGSVINLFAGPSWKRSASGNCEVSDVSTCEGQFYLLDGYKTDVTVNVDGCNFSTPPGEEYAIYFHTGPTEEPVLCAPELERPNAIPIEKLVASGSFGEGCNSIVNGHLEGCIALDEAARLICFCTDPDYDCLREPLSTGSLYCMQQCGAAWLSFGTFIRDVAGLEPNCDIDEDGTMDAYRIAGVFEAEVLPQEGFSD